MQFRIKRYRPWPGEERRIKKFAWWPTVAGNYLVWLEKYGVMQKYDEGNSHFTPKWKTTDVWAL